MINFIDRIERRETAEVDGIRDWTWVVDDRGAWDGPKSDWETSHKELYLKYLKDRKSVVIAGGNCGMYVRMYANLFDVVWAFEPSPIPFHCMVNNNTTDNVVKMQLALGDQNKMISLNKQYENSSGYLNIAVHKIDPRDSIENFIPMIKLDTLNLPSCSFMQLDVEGYEGNVIRGARNTIEKFRPVIAAENGHANDVSSYLKSIDYMQAAQSRADCIWIPKENLI